MHSTLPYHLRLYPWTIHGDASPAQSHLDNGSTQPDVALRRLPGKLLDRIVAAQFRRGVQQMEVPDGHGELDVEGLDRELASEAAAGTEAERQRRPRPGVVRLPARLRVDDQLPLRLELRDVGVAPRPREPSSSALAVVTVASARTRAPYAVS